jgi:hypothetical protein
MHQIVCDQEAHWLLIYCLLCHILQCFYDLILIGFVITKGIIQNLCHFNLLRFGISKVPKPIFV